MGVITKPEILRRIINEDLVINPNLNQLGGIVVEGSSYDLCVGTIISKNIETKEINTLHYNSALSLEEQEHTTLQPGQMLLVVTKEEVKMPLDLSATVYSRNQLARDGILALNAGHVDPGYEGPIIIRLINLRAISYTLKLGSPIYTIVFQKLDTPLSANLGHSRITRNESIAKATRSVDEALANPLHDLSMLGVFVKKDEFGIFLWECLKNNILKAIGFIVGVLVIIATIASGIQPLLELIKGYFK